MADILSKNMCIETRRTYKPDPISDSKVHGANMGLTWVLSAPDRPHVGPMNLAIRDIAMNKGDVKGIITENHANNPIFYPSLLALLLFLVDHIIFLKNASDIYVGWPTFVLWFFSSFLLGTILESGIQFRMFMLDSVQCVSCNDENEYGKQHCILNLHPKYEYAYRCLMPAAFQIRATLNLEIPSAA